MTKQHKQIAYSIGVVVVLVGILYVMGGIFRGPGIENEVKLEPIIDSPIVVENPSTKVDTNHMYLGMKTWNWVAAKDVDGKKVTPTTDKPFTLTFDFTSGKFSVTTDCNSGSGLFAAKSGVVQFGEIASTKMYCEGSLESVFNGLLSNAQRFYFTSKGEMVLTTKDGGSVTFR